MAVNLLLKLHIVSFIWLTNKIFLGKLSLLLFSLFLTNK